MILLHLNHCKGVFIYDVSCLRGRGWVIDFLIFADSMCIIATSLYFISRAVFIDPFFKDSSGHTMLSSSRTGEHSLRIKVTRFTRSKKFKFWIGKRSFVFSRPEIKRLLTDKLRRSANLHAKLYRCRIFKKCNNYRNRKKKKKSKKKTHNRTENKNRKRKNKTGRRKGQNVFGRAVGLKMKKLTSTTKQQKKLQTKKEDKASLFRGVKSFLQ